MTIYCPTQRFMSLCVKYVVKENLSKQCRGSVTYPPSMTVTIHSHSIKKWFKKDAIPFSNFLGIDLHAGFTTLPKI